MRLRARPLSVAVLGGGCLAAALLLWAPGAFNLRDDIREVMFDRALPLLASPPETSPVVVVDIDRESLARYGAWPWRRQVLADLVRKIAEAKPRVIGLDMLLSEPDRFSPIGLVRNLGTEADRSGIADLARKLPDGDAALADALKAAPVVLGFVLEPGAGEVPPGAPDSGARPPPGPRHLAGRRRDRPRAGSRQRSARSRRHCACRRCGRTRPPRAASCLGRGPGASRLCRRGLARRL